MRDDFNVTGFFTTVLQFVNIGEYALFGYRFLDGPHGGAFTAVQEILGAGA